MNRETVFAIGKLPWFVIVPDRVCRLFTFSRFENSRNFEIENLTVSFAAMSYTIDNDSMRSIINGVQNAIVAYTKAVSLGSLQFSNTGRTWRRHVYELPVEATPSLSQRSA
jgi:hypothetical protein